MNFKNLALVASLLLTSSAWGQSAEELSKQADELLKKGNFSEAAIFYEKACNAGSADDCGFLGVLYAEGKRVEQNYSKAENLLGKGCNKGNPKFCVFLGTLYMEGKGVKQDLSKAEQLFEKACKAGENSGCEGLQILKTLREVFK